MSQAEKLPERMERNPRNGWDIEDVQRLCRAHGVTCASPARGSHFTISHLTQMKILTIPARRPIKPVYITALVAYIQAVKASVDNG